MEWTEILGRAIDYIEAHIADENLSVEEVALQLHISPFYFQRGFSLLCGYPLGEYIRKRRLALAGEELASSEVKVIDLALKYGYDSPDSFAKAFVRFHGSTPSAVRRDGALLRSFAPLQINISLKGGYLMDYRIVQKDSFTVVGARGTFRYEDAKSAIPKFWAQHCAAGNGKYICGKYGINHDANMDGIEFEYLIADDFDPMRKLPETLIKEVIPAFTWAVFPCRGALPDALQETNRKIFAEWLPNCREYAIAAGYCIELYDDVEKYPCGMQDENYYTEMWIPVMKK